MTKAFDKFIECPNCHFYSNYSDFPDLYYRDEGFEKFNKQVELLEELQQLGYNIVTCGNCGLTFLTKAKEI